MDGSSYMASVWILSGVIFIVAYTGIQTGSGDSVVTWIHPGRDSWLVLAEAWLLYDRGGNHHRGVWQFDRWKQKEVRLEPGKGRQRLLVDDGEYPIEIGPTLSETDRQWLAEVIRSWLPEPGITQLAPYSQVGTAGAEVSLKPAKHANIQPGDESP
jgi:hypothetical protein